MATRIKCHFASRWPSRGYKRPSKLSKEQKALEKCIGEEVLNKFDIGQAMGDGKDAWVVRVRARSDKKTEFALKVFNGKSISMIKKEIAFQKVAAKLGLSPQVVSNWDITGKNRCFAMVKLDRTLKQLVQDQGMLTSDQQSRMIQICESLSRAGIDHNDFLNIQGNIMADQNGKLYLIDFGYSEQCAPGEYTNATMLVRTDRIFAQNPGKGKNYKPVFTKYVRDAEIKCGRIFDFRAKHSREAALKAAQVVDAAAIDKYIAEDPVPTRPNISTQSRRSPRLQAQKQQSMEHSAEQGRSTRSKAQKQLARRRQSPRTNAKAQKQPSKENSAKRQRIR